MATNNYIQIQIISRNMDFSYSGGKTTKVSNKGKLDAKTGLNLSKSAYSAYADLPEAGTDETWYGIGLGSHSYYTQTGYAPFGIQNLQLSAAQDGLKFVVDLIHTETNGDSNSYKTSPFLRTSATYGKFIYAPFNSVINEWVGVDENNIIKVYVNSTNATYFDQLTSTYRSQIFLQVIGHWEAATSVYNITDMATNCSGDNSQTTIEQGEDYTNTFTPDDGYAFNDDNKPDATCGGIAYPSEINQDGTATIVIHDVQGNVEITGGAVAKHALSLDIYNCVLYDGEFPYEKDYVLDGEKYHFALRSNDGFVFKISPHWEMGTETGGFALYADDETKASIRWNLYTYIITTNDLAIQANATLSPSMKYGFVSIYNPTYDEVDELSKKRFFSSLSDEYADLSQYIISFRKLYVDIPQIARELVYYGRHNTNVSANIVTTNFIETDCGSVTISEYNGNSLDYNGVEIELYLPFIGVVTLNANQVYNKELHLIYRTNPINGDCVAILYSDNVQVAYSQGNVSFDVPINFKYGSLNNNSGMSDNALYMCELQPYVEIKTNRQYQSMNSRLLNNNIWTQVSECIGYVEFTDIELNPIKKICKDEYDEIISIMQSGIIV